MNLRCVILATALTGCASSGPVPTGPDSFMSFHSGWNGAQPVGQVKAEAVKSAGAHCATMHKTMVIIGGLDRPGSLGRSFPEVELQYRCVSAQDPENVRPVFVPTAPK